MPKPKLDWFNKKPPVSLENAEQLRGEILGLLGQQESEIETQAEELFAVAACAATELYMNAKNLPTSAEINAGLEELINDAQQLRIKLSGVLYHRLDVEVEAMAIKYGEEWSLYELLVQLRMLEEACNAMQINKRRNRKVELCIQIKEQFEILLRKKPTIYASRNHDGLSLYAQVLSMCFKAADNGQVPSDLDRLMSQARKLHPEYKSETVKLKPELVKVLQKRSGF